MSVTISNQLQPEAFGVLGRFRIFKSELLIYGWGRYRSPIHGSPKLHLGSQICLILVFYVPTCALAANILIIKSHFWLVNFTWKNQKMILFMHSKTYGRLFNPCKNFKNFVYLYTQMQIIKLMSSTHIQSFHW